MCAMAHTAQLARAREAERGVFCVIAAGREGAARAGARGGAAIERSLRRDDLGAARAGARGGARFARMTGEFPQWRSSRGR
jgi:general stress protein YciG